MGLDHFKVTVSPTSKVGDYSSLAKTVTRNSDNFIRDYDLIKEGSKRGKRLGNNYSVLVTIEGYNESQKNTYYSNNPRLIKAVKKQDDSLFH
jgi:ketol-acid reductoisomerase